MKKEINLSDILEEMCLTGRTLTPLEAARLAEALHHEAMRAAATFDFSEKLRINGATDVIRWRASKICGLARLEFSRLIEGEFRAEPPFFLMPPELQKLQEDLANLQSELGWEEIE